MKKNLSKIYKLLALIIGSLGGVGGIVFAYLRSKSIVITKPNYSYFKFISFFQFLFQYLFWIFIVCLLLYAIGHIIELLQLLNQKLSSLSTEDNVQRLINTQVDIPKINPDLTNQNSEIIGWSRPYVDEKNSNHEINM